MASLAELVTRLEPDLARQVFTHSSWAPERTLSYERLEFLGDSVLGVCISAEIYQRFPEYNEGELAKVRAYVVSRHTCAIVGAALGLQGRIVEQAEAAGVVNAVDLAENVNVRAAVLEALIGAFFFQFGLDAIFDAINEAFSEHIDYAASEHVDFKTALQEEVAKFGKEVSYNVIAVEGPPHERTFTSEVLLNGEVLGSGNGKSKKVSQQESAKEALEVLRARKGEMP